MLAFLKYKRMWFSYSVEETFVNSILNIFKNLYDKIALKIIANFRTILNVSESKFGSFSVKVKRSTISHKPRDPCDIC